MAATSKPTYEELQAALQKSEGSRQKLRATLVTPPSGPPSQFAPQSSSAACLRALRGMHTDLDKRVRRPC